MIKLAFLVEPPFGDRQADGTPAGCDVELARTVLAMVGVDDVEPVETEFAHLLPGLADGRWRMTTGLFVTDDRRRVAAFSRPIWALPDGLLVPDGNPMGLTGYQSVARTDGCVLAVVRGQVQHRSAVACGVPEASIIVLDTYAAAARAVVDGRAQAYASVAQAHAGFLRREGEPGLEVLTIGDHETGPAFGAFAFNGSDAAFRQDVDGALSRYLGSDDHRAMMNRFGFSDAEVDRVVG